MAGRSLKLFFDVYYTAHQGVYREENYSAYHGTVHFSEQG
jgi:hypothetical protein